MLPDSGFVIGGTINPTTFQPAPYIFLLRTDNLGIKYGAIIMIKFVKRVRQSTSRV